MADDRPTGQLPLTKTMDFQRGIARQMAPGVLRLVANNPGPFTFKGTNTYLIGTTQLVLIDPGPHDEDHVEAILSAAGDRPISHIFVTHTHRDHTDGLASLLARLPPEFPPKTCGFVRQKQLAAPPKVTNGTGSAGNTGSADGTEDGGAGRKTTAPIATAPTMPSWVAKLGLSARDFIDVDFKPDIALQDGDVIEFSGFSLQAIHTPGHAPDHLCFALTGPQEVQSDSAPACILFSGDHIMAWNTSVIAPPEGNMADYVQSLERLAQRQQDKLYLPGHGGQIEQPQSMIRAYLIHRQWRERTILQAVNNGADSITKVVAEIYTRLDERLIMAASFSVLAHIEHLAAQNLVTHDLNADAAPFGSTVRAV